MISGDPRGFAGASPHTVATNSLGKKLQANLRAHKPTAQTQSARANSSTLASAQGVDAGRGGRRHWKQSAAVPGAPGVGHMPPSPAVPSSGGGLTAWLHRGPHPHATHTKRVVPLSGLPTTTTSTRRGARVIVSASGHLTGPETAEEAAKSSPEGGKSTERPSNRAWRSRTGRARVGDLWVHRDEQLARLSVDEENDDSLAAAERWTIQERVNHGDILSPMADPFESQVLNLITSPASVELSPAPEAGDISMTGRRPPIIDEGFCKPEATGSEILLQGFNWESHKKDWYSVVGDKAKELKESGFSLIWMPPASQSVSDEGYMPGDYYNLNSNYGSQEELKEAIGKLHNVGLGVLADIVVNHRCAQFQDEQGIWNKYGGKMDWDQRAIVGDDPNFRGRGHHSTGAIFHAAPNIDHKQDFVREDIKLWLNWLRAEVGFDGWRFDFTKGYGGEFVGEYCEATEPLFSVGEFWDTLSYSGNYLDHNQNGHRQRTVDWINAAGGRSLAFDMTTKGILHAVIENKEYWRLSDQDGRPPGVMGYWPSRTCTFIENHDTGSTQGHWRFPEHGVEQGYAYILTHPGTPCVFWDHFMAPHWQPAIKKLMQIRRDYGINCRSQVHIIKADSGVYAAQIDGLVMVKIGPRDWSPNDSSWENAGYGHEWCVWTLKGSRVEVPTEELAPLTHEDSLKRLFEAPPIIHGD